MAANALAILRDLKYFLVFLINRFLTVLDTATPCDLPSVTVEGKSKMLKK